MSNISISQSSAKLPSIMLFGSSRTFWSYGSFRSFSSNRLSHHYHLSTGDSTWYKIVICSISCLFVQINNCDKQTNEQHEDLRVCFGDNNCADQWVHFRYDDVFVSCLEVVILCPLYNCSTWELSIYSTRGGHLIMELLKISSI